MAMLGTDGRTERNAKTVMDEESWKMIFDRLEKIPPTTQHLLTIFAVPFSFIRVKVAEKVFEFLKNRALRSPLPVLPADVRCRGTLGQESARYQGAE